MNVSVLNFLKRKQKKEEKKEKKQISKEFVAQIQPQGGIKFQEVYVQGGDGLQSCIHVYGYQTTVNDFWLEPIMNMPNVITTLDIISDMARSNDFVLTQYFMDQKEWFTDVVWVAC